ncbi:uncharacterized protein LOC126328094 [Schistocerca gregaria]|uniref:uncharacterized protein LOC126328094 n=1 Tax=Schistocerca gregaria TaxID=7010 RepID=UPI00211E5BCA|nr:uncharacterized protein LOC126328094 [Schistocerca gregaria]
MEDSVTKPTNQQSELTEKESAGERQRSEAGKILESSLATVGAEVEPAEQKVSLPSASNPCKQQGTAAVGDTGPASSSGGGSSQKGSGSSSGSGFDADVDETDYTVSVASSADLIEAHDSALEALELGNQKERNTFIWIDKCLDRVGSASSELRTFAVAVLNSACIGNDNVQSIINDDESPQSVADYKQRLQAIQEYLLAAYQDFAVQENAKMVDLEAKSEETGSSSEDMKVSSSKDFMESAVGNQGDTDACGETKLMSSEGDGKTDRSDDDLETERSGDRAMMTVKTDGGIAEKNAADDVLNSVALEPDLVNRSGGERGSVTACGGKKRDHQTSSGIEKAIEGGAVEDGHRQPAINSSNSKPEEARLAVAGEQEAGEAACKRAQIIRKLVTRQREALSRMSATVGTCAFRLNSACHFLLTCVKCAACVCSSCLHAHGLAELALQIAESSGIADLETVREAATTASQNTDLALASCEKAVQLHKDAFSILEEVMTPLVNIRADDELGEHTLREVSEEAEDVKQILDQRANGHLAVLANKLTLMESMMDTLSHAVKRAKDVSKVTKQLVKKFDDAAFQFPVVAAAFGTTQFALRTMTATTNALRPLSQLGSDVKSEQPSDQENPPENGLSAGHGNIQQERTPVDQANDLQNAECEDQSNSAAEVRIGTDKDADASD